MHVYDQVDLHAVYHPSKKKNGSIEAQKRAAKAEARKYCMRDLKEFPRIEFNENTRTSPELFSQAAEIKLAADLTHSHREQCYRGEKGFAEIAIGLDWGTATTKVVLMEQASKRAFALAFGDTLDPASGNYVLPSRVYRNENIYSLTGRHDEVLTDLKLPFLFNNHNEEHIANAVAFLALIIRHAREWFLTRCAKNFYGFEFEWHYRLGIPAANISDTEQTEIFQKLLHAAANLSLISRREISVDMVKRFVVGIREKQYGQSFALDLDFIGVMPEISAQLHGYVRSGKWDARRPKFMMIDIGGGTVDAAIVNVTKSAKDELVYNCLKSHVEKLGTVILHKKRIEWIGNSAEQQEVRSASLLSSIRKLNRQSGDYNIVPSSERDYLVDAKFPDEFSLDHVYDVEYATAVGKNVLNPVKTKIDSELTQWKSLQLLLCGGGSKNTLYHRYLKRVDDNPNTVTNFQRIRLLPPDNFSAPGLEEGDYHRLSVAYGLSFLDIGKYVPESEIDTASTTGSTTQWNDNFVSKDMV